MSLTGTPSIVDHRDTMHTAILGQVVGDGIVLGDTVVPHRHRPRLPADLTRSRIEYDLTAQEKSEFERLTRIGEEVSETLDFTPAKLTVIEHARAKYRCE